jgi:hypothetical protein
VRRYPNCQIGYQSSCQNTEFISTAQASVLRVPLAAEGYRAMDERRVIKVLLRP